MRIQFLLLTLLIGSCAATSTPEFARLPEIPASGWRSDDSDPRSWSQDAAGGRWQIADYNSDGRVDYIRYQTPPDSYNHRVWIDRDNDGFLDSYTHADPDHPLGADGAIDIHLPVPDFEPARQSD